MAESPTIHSGQLLRFKITSNHKALGDTVQVVSIKVSSAVNKIPSAQIVILDGRMPDQAFPVSDDDVFQPGSEIVIEAGYDDKSTPIFSGIVIRHGLRITDNNDSRLVIECRDKAIAMTIGRKNANYVDMKESDIFAQIIDKYPGIAKDVSATQTKQRELVQHYCTDWDFLLSRAEINGMIVVSEQNKLTVQAPQTSGTPPLTVEYGFDLIDFQADIDSRTQLTSVKAVVWDPAAQAVVQQTASPPTLNSQGDLTSAVLAQVAGPEEFRVQTPAPLPPTEVKAWAESQQLKAGLARIRGRMKFRGSAKARIGTLIKAKGVGNRFSGEVFVCAVEHQLVDGDWTTEVEFGMPPRWFAEQRDLMAPPASGLLPGIEGLHLGVVKQLNDDPAKENRIQVSIPVLQAENDGVWARLSHFYASQAFGDFFIPEIGDEVVLGYLNDDPSNPVILGSLYSSNRTPPYALTAENYTKAIVTRSQLRLLFDDEKKVITLITPGNNQIVVSDDSQSILLKDQNGNQAQLSPDGILLDSPKDITVKAKGKIALSAVNEISLVSQADVKVSGLNVSHTAQVGFTAKGNATAELSASGQTTVQGALVMIN